ncbi:hypothetical protein, partial [Lysobacter enzymogenes]|uniref:hypothetical protein n=1 Tax=Lysobacter enzymogenes TaxID=69 RepID=UPI00089C8A8D
MKPPICHLCGRNMLGEGGPEGDLVAFADFQPLPYGVAGHPHGLEWFCAEHLSAAQSMPGWTALKRCGSCGSATAWGRCRSDASRDRDNAT